MPRNMKCYNLGNTRLFGDNFQAPVYTLIFRYIIKTT